MGVFQYKTTSGGVAADVPTAAQGDAGSGGSLAVLYPEAGEFDGNGLPCGAVGRPRIEFATPAMTGTGVAFWQGLFSTSLATSVQIWLTAWNPRTGAWEWWTGYLLRPTWQGVEPAGSQLATIYSSVSIRVVELQAA